MRSRGISPTDGWCRRSPRLRVRRLPVSRNSTVFRPAWRKWRRRYWQNYNEILLLILPYRACHCRFLAAADAPFPRLCLPPPPATQCRRIVNVLLPDNKSYARQAMIHIWNEGRDKWPHTFSGYRFPDFPVWLSMHF